MKKISKLSILSFLLLTAFLLSQNIFAKDYSNGILNSNDIIAKSNNITLAEFPNANDVLIDATAINNYNPDGTGDSWSDSFIKVLTEKGKNNNRVLSFSFTFPYSDAKVTRLEIIKPNGMIQPIDIAKQSRIMIESGQMGSNIYNPNDKTLTISIPNLEVNDIIRCVSNQKILKPIMPNTWYDAINFEGTTPIVHSTYKIIAPNQLPIQKIALLDKVNNTVQFSDTKDNGSTIYQWTVNNVPRMFPEPQMPTISSVTQRLLTSTIPSWIDISKWYWDLCKPHLDDITPEMKNKVDELTLNAKSDTDKIKNIFYFVSQKIRYSGIIAEQNAPGFEPHDAKLTFNNKYGVCRDKAALLVSMLRIAGFSGYPVLIKVGPKLDNEVPLIYFNHAIVGIELKPNEYILMDPTNENTKELFPAYLSNLSYLVAKPNGDILRTTPIIPAEKNMMLVTTNGCLEEDGTLKAKVSLDFEGINDNLYRNVLVNLSQNQRKLTFWKILTSFIPSIELTNLSIYPENLQDTSIPLKITIEYKTDNLVVQNNNIAMLTLPWLGQAFGFINYTLGEASLEKRKYPLKTDVACGYKETLNINIKNKNYHFNVPPAYQNINNEIITYKQNLDYKNNLLIGTNRLISKTIEFSPEEYLRLKNALKIIEINRKKKPIMSILAPENNNNDCLILSEQSKITLHSINSWTESYKGVKKVLTYKGKIEGSEVKLSYNPEWETVKIENVIVTSPDGKKHKVSKNEINIMDAPWIGSAPRYPKENILVATLPGIEIGSTIEVEITKTSKNQPFYSDLYSFQEFNPITDKEITLKIPNNLKLKFDKYNFTGINETITKKNNFTTYKWSTKNQPAIQHELQLPPTWTFLPCVLVSTASWETYSKSILEKLEKATENQPITKQQTDLLLKNINSGYEKIKTIRDFVATHIRPAGPSFVDLPLSAISNADKTLRDGYGNNADTAILLVTMLKYAGFKPKFLLTSNIPATVKQITTPVINTPQRSFFKNVIVRITTSDNKCIYLNDTDEYSELGTTGSENNLALNLKDGKTTTIEPQKDKNTKSEISYNIKLSDDSNAIVEVTKKYFGNYYNSLNRSFSQMRPEDRKRYFQGLVADLSQSAVPIKELYTDFSQYPGMERFAVKIDNFSIVDGNYYYFTSPATALKIFNVRSDAECKYPYYQDSDLESHIITKIILPPSFCKNNLSPKNIKLTLPKNSGIIEIDNISDTTGTCLIQNTLLHITPALYSSQEYLKILDIYKQTTSPDISTYLMGKK